MLQFFKSALLTRLLVLLGLLLALRLPLLAWGLPLMPVELREMLLGERLNAGAYLYRDLYDSTAPLAAALAGALELVGHRPLWLYRLLALVLITFQGLRFNFVLNRADVLPERGYVAALVFLLVGSVTTDLDILSPLLVGHTFLIAGFSALLPTSREGYDNRRLFRAGFLIGVAALCYLPLALFLLLGLFAVVLFAANSFRSFLLLVCGFLFPYAVVATFFLYADSLPAFTQLHLRPTLSGLVAGADGLPVALQLRLLIIPGLVLALGLGRSLLQPPGLVFQVKFQQLMLGWLLVAGGMAAAGRGVAPGTLVLVLPPLTYFSLYLWQKSRRAWVPELGLLLLVGAVLVVRYRAVFFLDNVLQLPLESRYAVQPNPRYRFLQDQRILVLGPDMRPYAHNSLATPYLDWQLAQADFGHLNQYDAVFRLARNFRSSPPRYLIDQRNLMPELQYKVPNLFGRYQPTSTKGVYRRMDEGQEIKPEK
ncbi:hypothetical protein CDA63_04205 [Hymenobacter amundsenii]|uniref:Glycosyltransferase RgtA/B/C/D-like domain-containing protein n=1 Tax=Hymenobacter amundsenii TaxID=2006685 RepID=A0A246FND5_9BACT|nr:hypothetical protein [Hymenobacter amundsenii]OWP64248.1 hypothetical protein CDA63_04205 [Hymenobacter amundsenii]